MRFTRRVGRPKITDVANGRACLDCDGVACDQRQRLGDPELGATGAPRGGPVVISTQHRGPRPRASIPGSTWEQLHAAWYGTSCVGHARGLSADLQVHWLGREGLPEDVLGEDERWTLLRRCLRDDSLALPLRLPTGTSSCAATARTAARIGSTWPRWTSIRSAARRSPPHVRA